MFDLISYFLELDNCVAFGILGLVLGVAYAALPFANLHIDSRFPEPQSRRLQFDGKPPSTNEILRLIGLCTFSFLAFILCGLSVQRILLRGLTSAGWPLLSVALAIVIARTLSRLLEGKTDA